MSPAIFSLELYLLGSLGIFVQVALVGLVFFLVCKYRQQHARINERLLKQLVFSDLGHRLNNTATAVDASRIITDTAQELFGWDAATLNLYDADSETAESIVSFDLIDGKVAEIPLASLNTLVSPIMREVLERGPQLILRTKSDIDQFSEQLEPFGNVKRRSASLMFVPIRNGSQSIGVLSIQSYKIDAYDQQDLETLQSLADYCSGALERIRVQRLVVAAHSELESRVQERTAELAQANELLSNEVEKHTRTEAALFKEQHLMHSFIETIPDSIYFKDREGRFIRVNKEKLRRSDLNDVSEILGKTDFNFFAPHSARQMQADEASVLQTGKPLIAKEERLFQQDGTVKWMLTTKMPLRNENGEIMGTFGVTRDITQQKNAEQALVQSQHLLETLMNHVPDYIYFKDCEGRFTRVNRAFANQFGNCEPDGIKGKTDFDFLGEAAARESLEDEQKIISTGQPLIGKEEHEIWLDGSEWWVLTSKMPFRDAEGNIIGICGITRDITQRKKAEEALQSAHGELEVRVQERTTELSQANQRLLAEIVERKQAELRTSSFSNLGYWLGQARTREDAAQIILEVADHLLGWEAAYLQLYTPDYEKVIPVLAADLVDGKRVISGSYLKDESLTERDKRIISRGAEMILRTDEEIGSSDSFRFGDKKRASMSLMYVPIHNRSRVVGVMSIQSYSANAYTRKGLDTLQALADFCAGTLERIQIEESLRKSEERFSKAFMSSPVAMSLSTLREGRYLDVNESMLRLMGFARSEMLNKTSLELGIWQDAESRAGLIDGVMKNRSVRDMEFELRTKSGQNKRTLLSVELMDFGGEPIILVSIHDITERRSLEERLRHSQKMEAVGQLAAGVAHDFNNILTVIQGHAAMLLDSDELQPFAVEALKQMDMAAERAANLIKQLLAFSRKQVMQQRAINLNEVIIATTKMLQRLLGENISLQCSYSPTLPSVSADSGMIEQILMNLAVNARDAMPEGGKLMISTGVVLIDETLLPNHPEGRVGFFVRLTFQDSGQGMSPEVMTRIFEPFFTTKEVGKGTGLGLATVYGILQQHQGWIEVSSVPDEGACFKIYLPACDVISPVLETMEPDSVPSVSGGNETLLIVEDEAALRDLVRGIMEFYGYRILLAAHGKEALQVWEEHSQEIKLVLTDMVMPEGISGFELAGRLKAKNPDLKVVYTSGYSVDLFDRKEKLIEGLNFMAKPYQPRLLARAIRQCLDE